MRIPEDKIAQVLNATDIVDVISDVVALKKSGKNYFGLCPFHSEKTPSFSVSPDKQIFHCFGCHTGGDAFSFIMKYHGVSFPESVILLARKVGISIENVAMDPAERKKMEMKEAAFRINRAVKDFFCDRLQNAPDGSAARAYLERRGMGPDMISEFGIGFAPDAWDSVVQLLRRMKVSRSVAEATGLVMRRNSGNGYYDRFRNRIIFPIIDANMQIAGFGGRVMDDGMPKYLNSPETLVYSKGKILYGLHAARHHCRSTGSVYIVEGYFDFLSLYRQGIKNCVATLGTALTLDHVRLLKGYASRMVLVFDSDDAGINAAKRGVELFLKEGVEVRVLILPKGQDPDSFVSQYGKDGFETAAQQAISVMAFLTETAITRHGSSIEGKVAVLDALVPYLASIHESARRSLYMRDLSHRLGIDESAIMEKVRQRRGLREGRSGSSRPAGHHRLFHEGPSRSSSTFNGSPAFASFNEPSGSNDRVDFPEHDFQDTAPFVPGGGGSTVAGGTERREAQLLSMMIQCPNVIDEVKRREALDCFCSKRLKSLGKSILTAASEAPDRIVAHVMAVTSCEEDRELIASLAMTDLPDGEIGDKSTLLIDRLIHVRERHENRIIEEIREKERGGGADVPLELLKQRQNEIRKRRGYDS